MKTTHALGTLLVSVASVGLVACGGGDSTPATPTETTITGSAVKGPVNGATVTAKKADGTACGEAKTTNGTYTLKTTCTGDLIIEVSGGKYTDEATGLETPLSSPLKVMIAANGGSVTGVATPLTTMAFSSSFGGAPSTKAAFDAQAAKVAQQFGLSGINLATTVPVVSGTANAYGQSLQAVSRYLKDNPTKTLATITNAAFTNAGDLTLFNTAYNKALADVGSPMRVNFDGTAFNISGTGAGGGSGTCGVTVTGTVSAQGFTVPLNLSYCVKGLQGSCDSGNSSLSQAVAGQGGMVGAANLQYSYLATCPAGAFTFNIAS